MPEDEILAMCELSNDLLFNKISHDKYQYYIANALEIGQRTAVTYQEQDIAELYHQNGIKLQIKAKTKSALGVSLRGQAILNENECRIEVYQESLDALAACSNHQITSEIALQIHLAHEFFHFLEFHQKDLSVSQLEPIEILRIGKYHRTARVTRCSEIAAHKFAKELLQLPVLPNYYDYLYLIQNGFLCEKDFLDRLQEYRVALQLQ